MNAPPPRLFAAPASHARARPDAFLRQQLAARVLERLAALRQPPARLAQLGMVPADFGFPDTEILSATIDDATGALSIPAGADALADLGTLAMANDLPGALHQMCHLLPSGSLFVGAFYGGDSLAELRRALIAAETKLSGGAAPRVHPLITAEAGLQLLQRAGFRDAVSDRETLRLTYPDLPALVRDLRAGGLTRQLTARAPLPPRALFALAEQLWRECDPAPGGRLSLTLEIVALTGWTPDKD